MTTQLDLFGGGDERETGSNNAAALGLDARALTILHALEAGLLSERLPESRGGRLPADWKPSELQLAYARAAGCPDPQATTLNFREYWLAKAGAGARHVDWNLTWQTWCRRESEFRHRPQDGHRRPPGGVAATSADPWEQRLRSYLAGGRWQPMWGPAPSTGRCHEQALYERMKNGPI